MIKKFLDIWFDYDQSSLLHITSGRLSRITLVVYWYEQLMVTSPMLAVTTSAIVDFLDRSLNPLFKGESSQQSLKQYPDQPLVKYKQTLLRHNGPQVQAYGLHFLIVLDQSFVNISSPIRCP